jgi:hypothetical protein
LSSRRASLPAQAGELAGHINDLLNRTVTDGIRVTAVLRDDNEVGWVGYGVNRREPFPGRGIPLGLRAGPSRGYALHLPVGGKRFRPCLEDLVEMLIVEELTVGRPGWQEAIEEHRSRFRRIQLMAAVRDDPEATREELSRLNDEPRRSVRLRRRRGRPSTR